MRRPGLGGEMRRRDFIRILGSAAATWPLAARAQQRERLPRVAVLEPVAKDTPSAQARYTAFLRAFEQSGWTCIVALSAQLIRHRDGAHDALSVARNMSNLCTCTR